MRRRLRGRAKALRATVRARLRAWRIATRNRSLAAACFYCGTPFRGSGDAQRTVDHRVARSRGGSDRLANLVFACLACNQRKRDRPEAEFLASPWLEERRRRVAGRAGPPAEALGAEGGVGLGRERGRSGVRRRRVARRPQQVAGPGGVDAEGFRGEQGQGREAGGGPAPESQ